MASRPTPLAIRQHPSQRADRLGHGRRVVVLPGWRRGRGGRRSGPGGRAAPAFDDAAVLLAALLGRQDIAPTGRLVEQAEVMRCLVAESFCEQVTFRFSRSLLRLKITTTTTTTTVRRGG
jgi:hypothetical protein